MHAIPQHQQQSETPQVPKRFLLAEKGDVVKAKARYQATMAWRQEHQLDDIFTRKHEHFKAIKSHFPRFHYGRSLAREPVIYERVGRVNLKDLRKQGLKVDDLIQNFVMLSEFVWQVVQPPDDGDHHDDSRKVVSVLDVEGVRISDFVGDAVEYIRKTSMISEQHYPERCAHIYVINVPTWFDLIWSVVHGFLDEVTRQKVTIVRGKKRVFEALCKRIAPQDIPLEYQVDLQTGHPLAQFKNDPDTNLASRSPEDKLLYELMAFLNGDADAPAVNPLLAMGKKASDDTASQPVKTSGTAQENAVLACEVRIEEAPTQ